MKFYTYHLKHASEIEEMAKFYCRHIYRGTYVILKNDRIEEYKDEDVGCNIGVFNIENKINKLSEVAIQNNEMIITNFDTGKPLHYEEEEYY